MPGKIRTYYNPRTGQEVSEHYVVRIYRPALSDIEREEARRRVRLYTSQQRRVVASLADSWEVRQESLGQPVTPRNLIRKNAEFNALLDRFRIVSYEARHAPLGTPLRDSLYAADGEYAQLLVLLGRRLPDAGFPVGESAKHVGEGGSYINDVVFPALRGNA